MNRKYEIRLIINSLQTTDITTYDLPCSINIYYHLSQLFLFKFYCYVLSDASLHQLKKKKKKKKKEKKKKERMQILTETRYRVEGWPVSGTRGAARRSC